MWTRWSRIKGVLPRLHGNNAVINKACVKYVHATILTSSIKTLRAATTSFKQQNCTERNLILRNNNAYVIRWLASKKSGFIRLGNLKSGGIYITLQFCVLLHTITHFHITKTLIDSRKIEAFILNQQEHSWLGRCYAITITIQILFLCQLVHTINYESVTELENIQSFLLL